MTLENAHAAAESRAPLAGRIESLDQFRGYTVLGMFVVNLLGCFAVTPAIFKHHDTYVSYADTIMPQFFFAVGFAYRLTFLRRAATMSPGRLTLRFARRIAGLILLGAGLYVGLPALWILASRGQQDLLAFAMRAPRTVLFQALVHIGVTSLWILPVIGAGAGARAVFALGSGALHVVLSQWFYYDWVTTAPAIDGGPLGFLTWTIPTLVGSFAYDVVVALPRPRAGSDLLLLGCLLMVIGYGISCVNLVTPPNASAGDEVLSILPDLPISPEEITRSGPRSIFVEPPFVPPSRPVNLWTMSQRAGSASYLTFGAGLSLAVYAFFIWASDVRGWRVGILRTLGTNALAGYVIHIVLARVLDRSLEREASAWIVAASLVGFVTVCYLAVRLLERRGIYLRL